jgi:MYXO-CTERM domain-containing protein
MSSFLILVADVAPGRPLIDNNNVFYSVVGGALLLLILLFLWLRRGRRAPVDAEAGLVEKLIDYPPAGPGPLRLFLHGQPVRLRLVVMAPMGKRPLPDNGAAEQALARVLRGLGDVVRQDRPRVRTWPAQLSQHGFAPTFFRLTHRPEPSGKSSPWLLAAGPVRADGQQFLLGLALFADVPSADNNLMLDATQWNELFRVGPRT